MYLCSHSVHKDERKKRQENFAYVRVYAMCVYICLYCIVFIILIDIQQKICSWTIFHIVYLRNINQFKIRMLLFMLNNESFSYILSLAHALTHFLIVRFKINIFTIRTHTLTLTHAFNSHYR